MPPPPSVEVRHHNVKVRHEHDRVHAIVRDPTQPGPETLLQGSLKMRPFLTPSERQQSANPSQPSSTLVCASVPILTRAICRLVCKEVRRPTSHSCLLSLLLSLAKDLLHLVSPERSKGCSHPPAEDAIRRRQQEYVFPLLMTHSQ